VVPGYVSCLRLQTCHCRIFFFSSRRRHTRLQGDWSSDVCSSDLAGPELATIVVESALLGGARCDRLRVQGIDTHGEVLGVAGARSEERRVGEEWSTPRVQ